MAVSRRVFLQGASAAGIGALAHSSLAALNVEAPVSASALPEGASREAHRLTPVPIERVTLEDEFWSPKRKVWRSVTLRDCFQKFETQGDGSFNNFDRVRDGLKGGHAGNPWQDGLVYEMIRAAADFLRSEPDPELERQIDGYVTRIAAAAAKDPNGYLNTYTQLQEPDHRWGLNGGLQVWQHEIYNLGALVDAGVHYYRATGKTQLLATGVKIANHMHEFMGPPPKTSLIPCHALPEEALVGLYELFREQPDLKAKVSLPVNEGDYLSLAEYWIENRGHNTGKPDWSRDRGQAERAIRAQEYGDGRPSWGAYAQDDKPVFEQEDIHGHAVRATLLCSGIATAARVNDRPEYRDTAVRLWENMVFRRMHITGGVGASAYEEAFGPDYLLPNDAYLETCAAVGAGFFHQRMNEAFGHARYADELERTLFNGVLCGVSLKGDSYFYQNPLEADERHERWAWHDCPCCPPMFLKIMGAMPGYVYATDAEGLYVNLYVGSHAKASVKGNEVAVRQKTRYPWDGTVRLTVDPAQAAEFNLMLRVPSWCQGASLKVNGQRVATDRRVRGYVQVSRRWQAGDVVELSLPMPVRAMEANPKVKSNVGRVAMTRGPVVYCVESVDNDARPDALALGGRPEFTTEWWAEKLGGVVALRASAVGEPGESWGDTLYAPGSPAKPPRRRIVAVPYYANSNRQPASMVVWLPKEA